MQNEEINWLNFGVSTFDCLIFSLTGWFILIKFRFDFDRAVIATIITYFLCMVCRCAGAVAMLAAEDPDDQRDMFLNTMKLIDMLSRFLIIVIIYFFVFEMRIVHLKIESTSAKECDR